MTGLSETLARVRDRPAAQARCHLLGGRPRARAREHSDARDDGIGDGLDAARAIETIAGELAETFPEGVLSEPLYSRCRHLASTCTGV